MRIAAQFGIGPSCSLHTGLSACVSHWLGLMSFSCCDLHRKSMWCFLARRIAPQSVISLSHSKRGRCSQRQRSARTSFSFGSAIAFSKSVSGPEVKGALQARWVMTVIMVLLTFAIFLLIDYVRGQKQLAKQPVLQVANRESAARVVPADGGRLSGSRESPLSRRAHLGAQRESRAGAGGHGRFRLEAGRTRSTASRCRSADAGFARARRFGRSSATASR